FMNDDKKIPGGSELLNPQDLIANKLGVTYGAKVADLGCGGAGYFVMQCAQIVGDSGVVYAIDILKNVLSNVETRAKLLGFKNIKTIWSNLEKPGATKINNEEMDFVLLINILFQNNDHLNILKEATRITKHNGKLLIVDWKPGRFPIGPQPDNKLSIEQLSTLAQTLYLKIESQFNAGKFHYGAVLVKQ
ncbi:class I SAM-dependent methyltransferase, partial [Patescibacteria group bacterium]